RVDMLKVSVANRLQVGAWPLGEPPADFPTLGPVERARHFAVEKQPAAVLVRHRASETRQPSGKIRVAFVGDSGEVTPFVRDDERTLEGQQVAGDERLE